MTQINHHQLRQLIMGYDANAHHTLWASTGIDPRGECLVEPPVSLNLNILNQGIEPTFVICNREVINDLTLGTNNIANLVSN
jgi:hypothetical protein